MAEIAKVELVVGLEVHVELATRTKMFSRAPSIACEEFDASEPNTCIDPVVLGLPGALPVINREAVEMSMRVGLALGCQIAPVTRWDRKSYFYPDMPKAYQISQYDLPLCFDGSVNLPAPLPVDQQRGGQVQVDWDASTRPIGIIRAHLEEDAGKLLHEAPGGHEIDYSIVDLNRAGTPLLEIVTQPDFRTSDEVVLFCQMLRNICRFLGVTEGVLQKGHMRFEPNINCVLTLADGRLVRTPIVEVKNLNSYKAVRSAIEFEFKDQPLRWRNDAREMGRGTKQTRGWDEQTGGGRTVVQREKEDAHDYRYFPDPDLLPVRVDEPWVERSRAAVGELPLARLRRFVDSYGLSVKEAAALIDERDVCFLYEDAIKAAVAAGVDDSRVGKAVANVLLQSGAKRANESSSQRGEPVLMSDLGINAAAIGAIVAMREDGSLGSGRVDELFGLLCEPEHRAADARELAKARGMFIVRDDAALDRWCDAAIAEQPQAATDVRAGKDAAIGRLVGAAMKAAAGQGDAKVIRERLLAKLRG
ncbi:MAG: Asp-tRNA(Asn)/Glu-tRNA(Gln) amidotransferase subunit GatB [Phycisphaerales bacterium]